MTHFVDGPVAVFAALGIEPATKAASGRYLRSTDLMAGVRYWATVNASATLLGLQFHGQDDIRHADAMRQGLRDAGLEPRRPTVRMETYYLEVPHLAGGHLDFASLKSAKSSIAAIAGHSPSPGILG